ncbi:MAG TPA: serine hydroxymethyltransferase [Jiangellaceae bacterium]
MRDGQPAAEGTAHAPRFEWKAGTSSAAETRGFAAAVRRGMDDLRSGDPQLYAMLDEEVRRQDESLVMVASSSIAHADVLVSLASPIANVTAEGYPDRRFHAGCMVVDQVEELAIERACGLFGARYANVQPHSASVANHLVMCGLLTPGAPVLGMNLHEGGHLTHGAKASMSGQYFQAHSYGLGPDGTIDYDTVAARARAVRPEMIICGATAYSRIIDFATFRAIADDVGAVLLADISHIAGLVVSGLHPSPIDKAHVTTTCTHKQLFGPRGAVILGGQDIDRPHARGTLRSRLQRSVFPFFQGAPAVNGIAAKARTFAWCATQEFSELATRIQDNARALADRLASLGYDIVSGGTDNHIVLIDLTRKHVSGLVAEQALESVGIIVNKNFVPGDRRPASATSGLRLGTNTLAARGMGPPEMNVCADMIDRVLTAVDTQDDRTWSLPAAEAVQAHQLVRNLAASFPMGCYNLEPASAKAARPLVE